MSSSPVFSYLSPKMEIREKAEKGGRGLFAIQKIKKGELITVWGGQIVLEANLGSFPEDLRRHGIQIEEGIFLLSLGGEEPADLFNHSCNPNAGLSGQVALVSMRDIEANEEVCFDYAMSDGSPYDEFDCGCGEDHCRGIISGRDWMKPELQNRYRGYFSPYIQRRIERLSGESGA